MSGVVRPLAALAASGGDDPQLRRACFDSRRVQSGDLFCPLPGLRTDGRSFVAEAQRRGALAVLECAAPGAARLAARAACALAGHPSRELWVAAVTGTNGKTTVVHWVRQALQSCTIPTAAVGTLGLEFGGERLDVHLTTPPADVLQGWLAEVLARGARGLVLEASSHGLAQGRLEGLSIDAAAWTNLSHDHLDYHGDLDAYARAKAQLVHGLPADAPAFVPAGDARVAAACRGTRARLVRWGLDVPNAELRGSVRAGAPAVLSVAGAWGSAEIPLRVPGRHNAENLLLAFGLARSAGLGVDEAAAGLSAVVAPRGRLERIAASSPWRLYVDYAHTPAALERALAALREEWPQARIGVVFGAGGDRDRDKRAPMGAAAARGADWCVVTTDNPRTEAPAAIAAAVAAGVRAERGAAEIELDRRAAIRAAVERLAPGDVLLIAGKGHEDYQEVDGVRHSFDDRLELEEAVTCLA
ncbi:MAG TPA: UDP-N-acetylmuramoyl-L-alanyl-D-glutamate--2,6-diaminopimelate ligase [Planctomycetota bacterium]